MKQIIISLIFYIRGVIWYLILVGAIILKYVGGGTTPMLLFVVGSIIVISTEIFRIYSAGYLRGKQPVTRVQAEFLCQSGPFAYLRNPLYAANMIRGIGVCIAINEWYAYALFLVINAVVFSVIVPHEEQFLEEKFGDIYHDYKAATRRFIPRLTAYRGSTRVIPSYRASILSELHTIALLAVLLVFIYTAFVAT